MSVKLTKIIINNKTYYLPIQYELKQNSCYCQLFNSKSTEDNLKFNEKSIIYNSSIYPNNTKFILLYPSLIQNTFPYLGANNFYEITNPKYWNYNFLESTISNTNPKEKIFMIKDSVIATDKIGDYTLNITLTDAAKKAGYKWFNNNEDTINCYWHIVDPAINDLP